MSAAPPSSHRQLPPLAPAFVELERERERERGRNRADTGGSEVPSIMVSPSSPIQQLEQGQQQGMGWRSPLGAGEEEEEEGGARSSPMTKETTTPSPVAEASTPSNSSPGFTLSSLIPSSLTNMSSMSINLPSFSSFLPRLPTTSGPTIHLVHSSNEQPAGDAGQGEGKRWSMDLDIEQGESKSRFGVAALSGWGGARGGKSVMGRGSAQVCRERWDARRGEGKLQCLLVEHHSLLHWRWVECCSSATKGGGSAFAARRASCLRSADGNSTVHPERVVLPFPGCTRAASGHLTWIGRGEDRSYVARAGRECG